MRLYWKILLLALLPLFLALGFGFFRLEGLLHFHKGIHDKEQDLKLALLASRIEAHQQQLRTYAAILAGSPDATRAVEAGDTGFLVQWGKLFLDPLRISRVFFTDLEGVVLARAHDPYHFGDSLGGYPALTEALSEGQARGVYELEGDLVALCAVPVKLYGEISLGVALVATEITPAFLAFISEGTGLGLELKVEGFPLFSAPLSGKARSSVSLLPKISAGNIQVEEARAFFEEDTLGSDLLLFQRRIMPGMLMLSLFLVLGLFLLLRRYLRPFSLLVEDVTLLSGTQDDVLRLREKLEKNHQYVNHEASIIVEALSRLMQRVQETITLLEWTSRTDPLTQISNRLHLDALLESNLNEARRKGEPLSVAIFDLDHFKQVNDDFGHQAGDAVLQRAAEILKLSAPSGFVGRWGGEEFLAILPEFGGDEAVALGERVRVALEKERFSVDRQITISVGIAEMAPGDSPDFLVGRADKALYEAKATGRNKVVFREA